MSNDLIINKMKEKAFFSYTPVKYASVQQGSYTGQVRNLVFKFKDGDKHAAAYAACLVSRLLYRWYGTACSDIVIACVPSSCNVGYRRRFAYFSAVVANRCRQDNAMRHVEILGRREPLHRTAGHVCRDTSNYRVNIDVDFFSGRRVIIFDDLITTGATANAFAARLEAVGAQVLGGLFLARTVAIKIKLSSLNAQIAMPQHTGDYHKDIHDICVRGKRAATARAKRRKKNVAVK